MAANDRTVSAWNRVARGALSGSVLMALTSTCRTGVALDGDAGSAGVAGVTSGGSAGSGGASSRGGRGGSGGSEGSAARGGASATPSSGGAAGKGGMPGRGGSSGRGGSVATGGRAGSDAGAPAAGTSQGLGGAPTDAEGGAPSEGGTGGTDPSPTQDEIEQQTIARWNAVADDQPSDTYSFHWVADQFPHPTFAATGTAEGYGEFAIVLDLFLDLNFGFLAEHHQFLTPYYYVTASTSDVDLMVTFDELATDFSTGFGADYGDPPDAVKLSLAEHAANMKQYE